MGMEKNFFTISLQPACVRSTISWVDSRPLREGLEKTYAWIAEQASKNTK